MVRALAILLTSLLLTVAAAQDTTPPPEPTVPAAPEGQADAQTAEQDSVWAALTANEDFSIFVMLLEQAGLAERLQGPGQFTVLAPSNEAFNTTFGTDVAALQTPAADATGAADDAAGAVGDTVGEAADAVGDAVGDAADAAGGEVAGGATAETREGAYTGDTYLAIVNDPARLEQLLEAHIIEGEYGLNELQDAAGKGVTTLDGQPLVVETTAGGLTVDGVGFVATNVENHYANGVVHATERVIIPAGLQGSAPATTQ